MKKNTAIIIGSLIIISCFAIGISRVNNNKLKQNFINYTFKGENEHWSVSYNVKTFTYENIGKNYANYKLSISFKEDISILYKSKKLTYSYESSAGNGGTTLPLDNIADEEFNIFENGSRNIVENEDEIITVLINVDGKSETIKLKNNKIEP